MTTMSELDQTSGVSRRRFLGLGAGAGAAMALSACGGSSTPPGTTGAQTGGNGGATYTGPSVELSFWNGFTGGDGPFIKKMVSQFNAATKNVKVNMTIFEWAQFYPKLPAAVASGRAPDVAVMHLDQLATNAARQVIVPIDDVASALKLQESDFATLIWQGGIYKGKRYGIPLDSHPMGMYYNKSVLQQAGLDPNKPPQTHDDYMAALDQLKGKGIKGHWMTPFPFTGTFQFESLLWQFGGDLFDPNTTKATFDSDAGVQALTWMVDLVKKGYSPANVGQDADYVALQNGKNAFNWNGIWQINALAGIKSLKWGAAPLPQIGTEKAAWSNSHQFVVPRQSSPDQNKETAARFFINYLSKQSLEWAKSGKIPARKSVLESAGFKQLGPEAEFAKEVDWIHFTPRVPGIPDALALVDQAVNAGVLMKSDPASALKDAAGKATKIVQDNAKKYGA